MSNKWMNGEMTECMVRRMSEQFDGRMEGWKDKWINEGMEYEGIDGWKEGLRDGRMKG